MGESTYSVHGFSYASSFKQGNLMLALSDSVSLGRFMNETLSSDNAWTKFFSNKNYVEEAARFAQPGSVAAKKAFFEAHYKSVAAKKAAALVAQDTIRTSNNNDEDDRQGLVIGSPFEASEDDQQVGDAKVQDCPISVLEVCLEEKNGGVAENEVVDEIHPDPNTFDGLNDHEIQDQITNLDCTESSLMERPLLLEGDCASAGGNPSKAGTKKSNLSLFKSKIPQKTSKAPLTPANQANTCNGEAKATRKQAVQFTDIERSSHKPLCRLTDRLVGKDYEKNSSSVSRRTSSMALDGLSKDCKTPTRAPYANKAVTTTPASQIRSMRTPSRPSASGSKTAGPKWHVLSAACTASLSALRKKLQSPIISSPFVLRTEERAAQRKQKLEEKFSSNKTQNALPQTSVKAKSRDESKKLSYSFCFKALPLPQFYKEREGLIDQANKKIIPMPNRFPNKKHGTPPIPQAPTMKNPAKDRYRRIDRENECPNVVHQ